MQSAPMPRVEAADRIGGTARQPLPVSEEIDLPRVESPPPRVAPAPSLPRETLAKLQEALQELGECRKLIDAALEQEAA